MKSINKGMGAFEKSWQNAFDGADLKPSSGLWTGIEANIANYEAAKYKRGMVYYKWIAAAGIMLFAVLFGYYGYQSFRSSESMTKGTLNPSQPVTKERILADKEIPTSSNQDDFKSGSDLSGDKPSETKELTPGSTSSLIQETNQIQNSDQTAKDAVAKPRVLPGDKSKFAHSEIKALDGQGIKISEAIEELPAISTAVTGVPILNPDKDPMRGVLWAGLSMAPGYFDPNYQSQGSAQSLQSSSLPQGSIPQEEQHRSGQSISFGVELGMRLSEKWVLSSGVQYLNNNVQSSTNTILNQRTPILSSTANAYVLDESSTDISYTPTELDNSFQFLSIPVQAGYVVIDKKIKVLVNAGFSSDIFLKNQISAVDQTLESITIKPGANAPFRTVYFNGLMGARASYEFLPRYIISLEPTYKLAISDFVRPEANYSSLPSSFGIGVGVRYVFK